HHPRLGKMTTAPGESSGPARPNYASTSWRHPWDPVLNARPTRVKDHAG
nr:hypothetical protein [Tanacetum cinerariifolium]